MIEVNEYVEVFMLDAVKLLRRVAAVSKAKLVFMDPPFNQGEQYDVCDDKKPDVSYAQALHQWIRAAASAVSDTGSLWINLPDKWAANAVIIARDIVGLKLENWCLWHYRFAECQKNRFLQSKQHALWFSKGNPTVNREAALVPSDRMTIYNDSRIHTSADKGMRMDLDVWGFDRYWGRVQGNNKERRPLHENQLPEAYLKRVIEVCSNEGDLVVDPFGGSGTTATVASALKRHCMTGDISPAYCQSIRERVLKGVAR